MQYPTVISVNPQPHMNRMARLSHERNVKLCQRRRYLVPTGIVVLLPERRRNAADVSRIRANVRYKDARSLQQHGTDEPPAIIGVRPV